MVPLKASIFKKGFGFVIIIKSHDETRFFSKQLNGSKPEKGLCVSFVFEDTDKGATAKDLRQENPDRLARVTARVIKQQHALMYLGRYDADKHYQGPL